MATENETLILLNTENFQKKADIYYQSVEKIFFDTDEHKQDKSIAEILFEVSGVGFVLSVLPAIPFVSKVLLNKTLSESVKANSFISYTLNNFWVIWLISVIIFGLLLFLVNKWHTKDTEKREKRFLSKKKLAFCYLYSACKEIKNYNVNENEEHIKNAKKHLHNYLLLSDLTFSESAPIPDMVINDSPIFVKAQILEKKYSWFLISEGTKRILNAFETLEFKIVDRLHLSKELSIALPPLNSLCLFEFLKFSKEEQIFDMSKEEAGLIFLMDFVQKLEEIEPLKYLKEESEKKKKGIQKLSFWMKNIFYGPNIISCFLAWLILLTILSTPSIISVTNYCGIKIDSTIIVALIGIPFAGAVTFATYFSSRKEK